MIVIYVRGRRENFLRSRYKLKLKGSSYMEVVGEEKEKKLKVGSYLHGGKDAFDNYTTLKKRLRK